MSINDEVRPSTAAAHHQWIARIVELKRIYGLT